MTERSTYGWQTQWPRNGGVAHELKVEDVMLGCVMAKKNRETLRLRDICLASSKPNVNILPTEARMSSLRRWCR